ncbi:HET-domain-containing protein [Cercophora samala]|uniref:HET-domain-containing protein n=1 Tax=Cercophora samala TaxID=330535 RepID=A0AA39Z2I5_9PEZI|nr:HET-domain-containing protein [Cercophora samala]
MAGQEPKPITRSDRKLTFPRPNRQPQASASSVISSEISRSLQKSVFDDNRDQEFLPEGCINVILTPDRVRKELRIPADSEEKEHEEGIVNFVMQSAMRIFIITLITGFSGDDGKLHTAIIDLANMGITDKSLPLCKDNFRDTEGELLQPFNEWSVDNFCKKQWMVLVPIISEGNPMLELDTNEILPVTWKAPASESGSFGEVFRVRFHEKHYINPILKYDGTPADVAIKVIKQVYRDTTDQGKLEELKDEWDREVRAHIAMRDYRHPNIIEFIAAIKRGIDRYLLFRWAELGSLRQFWEAPGHKRPTLTSSLVRDVVYQIRGVADALDKLHTFGQEGESYRHGDLKPENILCCIDKAPCDDELNFPTLKVSDMGLAKHHKVVTSMRNNTSMQYTTTRYEPPEVVMKSPLGLSRRYDMWSFGCIALEMIVWLLYGSDSLEKFNSQIIDEGRHRSHWFVVDHNDKSRVRVHPHVKATIQALYSDPECRENTALRDLLKIVETKLLVVELRDNHLGPFNGSSPPKSGDGSRVYSGELMKSLNEIVSRGQEREKYWFTGISRKYIKDLRVQNGPPLLLAPPKDKTKAPGVEHQHRRLRAVGHDDDGSLPEIRVDEEPSLAQLDKTEFPVDNRFAAQLVADLASRSLYSLAPQTSTARLCQTCATYNLFEPQFHIIDKLADLDIRRGSCDFCKLRWEACHSLRGQATTARFDRDQSMLKLNENATPILSICRSADLSIANSHFVQIGFPKVPPAASPLQFAILSSWLKDCDDNHPGCIPIKAYPPPTRLVDLGPTDAPTTRLIHTDPSESYQYIALSHPWGQGHPFCTFPHNLTKHQKAIPTDGSGFPATFRDAITATRALGLRYLWIDSLCIIQGPDGDFEKEAKRMEDVFSSAYCVIAASSARGQHDGFLNSRKERQFIQLPVRPSPLTSNGNGSGDVYVCRFIDNFAEHVLNGPLSKRGWVLQERALARRTIYFTDWQAYWECGCGVRCETLTKVDNKLFSFLGDPSFPSKLSTSLSDRGERIRFYEDLYRQYSRLNFTRLTDRPIAIAGLEQRMISDLNAKGGYGILHDGQSLLPRSLLWRRGAEQKELKRVDFSEALQSEGKHFPSWSWMVYDGAIDYLDLPLGGVDWRIDAVLDPFTPRARHRDTENGTVELRAVVRPLAIESDPEEEVWGSVGVILDDGEEGKLSAGKDWRFVVVGTRKIAEGEEVGMDLRTHYLLIIAPLGQDDGGQKVYQRIGVGYMPGWFLGEEESERARVR